MTNKEGGLGAGFDLFFSTAGADFVGLSGDAGWGAH